MATITLPRQLPDTFTLTVPKADVSFFKTMAKKMGWTVERKKPKTKTRLYDPETGLYMNDKAVKDIEKAIEEVKQGKVSTYASVDDFFKEMGLLTLLFLQTGTHSDLF